MKINNLKIQKVTFTNVCNLKQIDGWKCFVTPMAGSIGWHNPNTDAIIFASPNWETMGVTPFAVDMGEYIEWKELQLKSMVDYVKAFRELAANFA